MTIRALVQMNSVGIDSAAGHYNITLFFSAAQDAIPQQQWSIMVFVPLTASIIQFNDTLLDAAVASIETTMGQSIDPKSIFWNPFVRG